MKPQKYLGFEIFMAIVISSFLTFDEIYKFSTTFTLHMQLLQMFNNRCFWKYLR